MGEMLVNCSGETSLNLACYCPDGFYGEKCQFVPKGT